MKEKLKELFVSKKTWTAIAAIVIPITSRQLGVSEESASEIFFALLTLLGGISLADFGKAKK